MSSKKSATKGTSSAKGSKTKQLTHSAASNKKKLRTAANQKNIYKRYNTSSKKRRSEGLIFIEEIDSEKLDKMVNLLFSKFIFHYEYEDTFALPDIPEITHSDFIRAARDEDFIEKLHTYFKIYRIDQKDLMLVSNDEEGSYILRHAKIWIMFLQSLINVRKIDFGQICEVFNSAIDFDVDEYLLFDYFFVISQVCDLKELDSCEESKIPKKFIEIYNDNKEHIMKVLDEEEPEEGIEPGNSDVSFGPLTKDDSLNPQSLNPFLNSANNTATSAVFNKIHTNRLLEEDSLDNSTEIDYSEDGYDLSRYLIATPEVSNDINVIYEEVNESDTEDKVKSPVAKKLFKRSTVLLKEEPLDQSPQGLIEVMIKEKNYNNSGNFAVLELSEKSRREEGSRFMITPLKPKYTYTEKKKIGTDVAEMRKTYSEFIYQPFDKKIYDMIVKTEDSELPTKRLSFPKLPEN
jgi:hypothetical protein